MSHTNSTTHYSLPQFVTTDKPAWLTDINNAYTAIDTGIYNAQTDATTAKNTADNAQTDATAAGTAASTADNKAAGAIASIADAFNTTATYSVGDLVMYNSLLYICSTAVTTPGAWTGSTNWTRTTVENQIPLTDNNLPHYTGTPAPNSTAAVIRNMAYHAGDTISESTEVVLAGHTSGAGTNAICYFPLSKPISSDVSSVSMQISDAVVYNNSGSTNITNGTYSATTTKDGLRFSLPISSALTGSIAVTVSITTRTLSFT